jgi:hypothetical protein
MSKAILKFIVGFSLLGLTAKVSTARLATDVAASESGGPVVRNARMDSSEASLPARATAPQAMQAARSTFRPMKETVGAAAKMFPEGLTKDFGSVPHGAQLVHRFPITNNQGFPIEIAYLQGGCGCVTARAAKRALQPGESTTIDVRLDGHQFKGSVMETVRVKVVGPDFESACKIVVSADGQEEDRRQPETISVMAISR